MGYRRIPSLNWLRVFEAAARAQSFARAAETLNMSAPAVSQQIRALEAHLGKDLFKRLPQRVELTEAGRAFFPVVGSAIGSVEATAASLFGRPDAAPLTVRVSAMFAVSWLGERAHRFMAARPDIQLTLLTAIGEDDFRRRDVDLMITFGQPPGAGEEGDALFGETLAPVARPDIAASIEKPADLARHTLIEVSSHRATWFRVLPEADQLPAPPRFIFTDTTLTSIALAANGAGVALARAPASDAIVRAYGLAPCLAGPAAPGAERYHLVYPARSGLSDAAAAFRAWLLAEASGAIDGVNA